MGFLRVEVKSIREISIDGVRARYNYISGQRFLHYSFLRTFILNLWALAIAAFIGMAM
jgi:hypothetical protein